MVTSTDSVLEVLGLTSKEHALLVSILAAQTNEEGVELLTADVT